MRRMYRSCEVGARWAPYTNFDASHRLEAPGLPKLREKLPKVSGRIRKYSRLAETIVGDRFDHHCRPRKAVDFVH